MGLHTAVNCVLNIFHLYTMVCGCLVVMMVSILQGGKPSFVPGCLLISLGGVTIVAGTSGIGRTIGPCFAINLVFNLLAAVGSLGFSLALFTKRSEVSRSFHSKRFSLTTVDTFFRRVTWAFYALVISEVMAVFLGIVSRQIRAAETPVQEGERRSIALQRLSQELAEKDAKRASREAAKLSSKVKNKYGHWMH